MAERNDPVIKKALEITTSEGEMRRREADIFGRDPYVLVRMELLKIRDKKQKLIPFTLNPVQKKVLKIIEKIRFANRPVRICILKGRQFGISTLMEAILYSYSTQRPNVNSLILSDDDDGSNYLFQMTKIYYEYMMRENPHLTPVKKVSNEKKLEFSGHHSQILIDTAKNVDAGRKYTFHMAHLSEASRFRDFDQTLLSLLQSVPDLPNTFVAIETTANGENAFSKFWWSIKHDAEVGNTEWVPIFLSWKDHEEYQKFFYTTSEKETFVSTLSEEEKLIMNTHDLSYEQMNWRRYKIKNDCGGKIEQFDQEFPLTDEMAFRTTGKRVFTEVYTRPQEKNIFPPKYQGELAFFDRKPAFIPVDKGELKVWKTPQKGHRYVVAVDTSAGIEGGDFSCAQVVDRSTWEQVATLHGRIPPDILGEKCYALGCWYGWAMMAPEINKDGIVTVLKLRDMFYPNIVHRTKLNFDDIHNPGIESEELGWETNVKTKPVIISDLREALSHMLIVIHDDDTLREIKKFSFLDVTESGNIKYGASSGHHDDRVIALAIAIHFAKTIPETQNQTYIEPPLYSNRRTGY